MGFALRIAESKSSIVPLSTLVDALVLRPIEMTFGTRVESLNAASSRSMPHSFRMALAPGVVSSNNTSRSARKLGASAKS